MKNSERQKRILLIEDLSFVGRCSATVSLPVISAAGIQCSFIPSTLLSTHTGFEGAARQSTGEITEKAAAQYRALGLEFDAIVVGYLGSAEQLTAVAALIDGLKKDGTTVIVDPAFADGGKLYSGYGAEYASLMRGLCSSADVITPNVTEAELMLGIEPGGRYDAEYIGGLLKKLCGLGAARSVITGLSFNGDEISVCALDSSTGEQFSHRNKRVKARFFGTGDLFTAVFAAEYTVNKNFKKSVADAANFAAECAADTLNGGETDSRFGVMFEHKLKEIADFI